MKKIANMFFGKCLLTIALVTAILVTGCNSEDYNRQDDEKTVTGTDSTVGINDTMVNNSSMDTKDTGNIASDTPAGAAKDSLAKPKAPGK